MTNQSHQQLREQYKNESLQFEMYYKYTFTYSNKHLRVSVGGDHNAIYRAELGINMTLEKLINECGDEYLEITELTPQPSVEEEK